MNANVEATQKIVRWGRFVQLICVCGAVSYLVLFCYHFFWPGEFLKLSENIARGHGIGDKIEGPIPSLQRAGLTAFSAIHYGVTIAMCWILFRLFGRAAVGQVMVRDNARALTKIGYLFFAMFAFSLLTNPIHAMLISAHLPGGERIISIAFRGSFFLDLLGGFVCLALGIIWEEAIRLQDEADHIV